LRRISETDANTVISRVTYRIASAVSDEISIRKIQAIKKQLKILQTHYYPTFIFARESMLKDQTS
jgi:hypothetical protein